tara:strand:+ start:915 stop:1184 length:270 start_codon:yes stop_codon:yes gene_type:complete
MLFKVTTKTAKSFQDCAIEADSAAAAIETAKSAGLVIAPCSIYQIDQHAVDTGLLPILQSLHDMSDYILWRMWDKSAETCCWHNEVQSG